jgi:hypothetical protein
VSFAKIKGLPSAAPFSMLVFWPSPYRKCDIMRLAVAAYRLG